MIRYDTGLSKKLGGVGLNDKEATIYAALMELGGAFPSKIAEVTGINRSTTYKILATLSIRGLVSEIERHNKLYYQAEEPKSLERYARAQVTFAERGLEAATQLLPKLEELFASTPNKPIVKFFEGRDGILKVYEDHLSQPEPYEMFGWSNATEALKLLDNKFARMYVGAKAKLGIHTRAIFPDTQKGRSFIKRIYAGVPQRIWPKARYIPTSEFPFSAEITAYGKKKVSIANFTDNKLTGTIIEDPVIHGMMRMIFDLSWQGAKNS